MKIFFDKGLLGLENCKNYNIEDVEDNENYKILSSIEDNDIQLVIMNPYSIKSDYEIDIPEDVVKNLKISKKEDVLLYTTVVLNSNYKKMTTNLRAPLVINEKTLLGEQIILPKDVYEIKHPIYKEEADVSNY